MLNAALAALKKQVDAKEEKTAEDCESPKKATRGKTGTTPAKTKEGKELDKLSK